LGAALLRKDVKEEVDGEGTGGNDTAELDEFTPDSRWEGMELFLAFTGILAK
jgi:hypothetical protein